MASQNSAGSWARVMVLLAVIVGGLAAVLWLVAVQPGEAENSAGAPATQGNHGPGSSGQGSSGQGSSLALSPNGLKNIGYHPLVVELAAYQKFLTLPAIVVERPGRSQLHITAPLTGIVTKIRAVTGEAIEAEQPLFELQLTHEELVAAQRDLLRTAENLDVVHSEIQRLQQLEAGVVAGRRLLEQQYEQQKLAASLHAERQALLLHGVSAEQIEEILRTRTLFRSLTVRAPPHRHEADGCTCEHLFIIQRLNIAQGQQVEVGSELAMLADHCELHIEALAFADDAGIIRQAARTDHTLSARVLTDQASAPEIRGLQVHYVADKIDVVSRAFKVFIRLPNEIVHQREATNGRRYIEWRYKPGQRLQILVPAETWPQQLVLPTTAVVEEGAEAYVYRQNGDHFDQVPVHVVHRDQQAVVVANNGALFPGDVVAGQGAYQMHLALRNQSGPAIDPHAGHNH